MKKRIIAFALAAFVIFALGGCGKKAEDRLVTGVEILGGQFYDYAEEFRNGYAFAVLGNECGYVDTKGSFTACYTLPENYGEHNITQLSEKIGMPSWFALNFFVSEEGLYPYYDSDIKAWGYKNIKSGKTVIQPEYCDAFPFMDGRAIVRLWANGSAGDIGKEAGKLNGTEVWVLDTKGKKLFQLEEVIEPFYEDGILSAVVENSACVINTKGEVLVNLGPVSGYELVYADYENMHYYPHPVSGDLWRKVGNDNSNTDYILVQIRDENGVMTDNYFIDTKGNITLEKPEGVDEMLKWFRDSDFTIYKQGELLGLMDKSGVLTEAKYAAVNYPRHGVVTVSEDGEVWYLADKNGSQIGTDTFDYMVYSDDNGLIPVYKNERCGFVDTSGSIALDLDYYNCSTFTGGIAFEMFENSDEALLINTNGDRLETDFTIKGGYTDMEGFFLMFTDKGFCYIYPTY